MQLVRVACRGGGRCCVNMWWCVWTCVCTWCSKAATQRSLHRSRPFRLCDGMFTEVPGPICWHNGVYFQKEGTLNQPSPSSSQIPSVLLSFPLYLSVALSLSLFYHCVSLNNAFTQFTSHLSLLCARTLSSPSSHYVVSVRFVDGVICKKTRGQRRPSISHIYSLVWYLGRQQKMAQKDNLSKFLWDGLNYSHCSVSIPPFNLNENLLIRGCSGRIRIWKIALYVKTYAHLRLHTSMILLFVPACDFIIRNERMRRNLTCAGIRTLRTLQSDYISQL